MKKIIFGVLLVSLIGCKEDPPFPALNPPTPSIVNAAYVLNEGNFGDPAGARLSLYDIDRDTVYKDVYESANSGQHLGSTGDDLKLYNGKAYVLMSGSENIVVINLSDHSLVRSATYGGDAPHDMLIDSVRNKIYVTRLYKNSVLVLDLSTLTIMDSIGVGTNPQGMALSGNKLFVCNSGYGSDRTVTVIDADADTVKRTLTLADGPTSASITADGKLWVACTGNSFGTPATFGKVFIINPQTESIEDSISFLENIWGSITAATDGFVYLIGVTPSSFYGGPVHRINIASKTVTSNFITGTFYALAYHTVSERIYAADAMDFSSDGVVRIYTNAGVLVKTFHAQKGPGVIAFR